jgi:predicted TIM-barrel fold metal-dependent hydrolase
LLVDIEFPGAPPPVKGTTQLPAPGSGSRLAGNTDMEVRLDDYARLGIHKQVLLPQFTGWWTYQIEPELGGALAHSWNLSMLRLMRDYPGRVFAVALLALQNVESAVAEVEWAHRNGFVGVVIDHTYPVWEHPYGTPTATHREVWPVFAKCEELDMPLYVHAVQHGHRIVNLMNFQIDGLDYFSPTDAQMNLVAFITSGLLDRFPRLKVIHAEMGAKHIAPLIQRLDARYERIEISYEEDEGVTAVARRKLSSKAPQLVPPEVVKEKNKHYPSHYFRNNFWWTIETEEPELVDAVRLLGAERFLFATDYPHDDPGGRMKYRDVALLAEHPAFSEEEKELIRHGNCGNLFPTVSD